MNTNKNTYTVLYATILVLLVAAILSIVSISLKDRQQRNVDNETRQNILTSVNLTEGIEKASDKTVFVEDNYKKFITDEYLVNDKGEKVEGKAFGLSLKSQYDIMKQPTPNTSKLTLPVFVCTNGDQRYEIFPFYGAGLWGPIWGYIALESDYSTIYGAIFDHEGETPGLGAEIATDRFRNQFKGKQLFENDVFTSVLVKKGGADKGDKHAVDAISGGTITSTSLQNTIKQWFGYYRPYIEKQLAAQKAAEVVEAQDNTEEVNHE